MMHTLLRKIVAEFVGTGFLVAAVVGSGIMGERLAGGNVAIALLANTIATGAALFALILGFGPISGGHFNPAVTLVDAIERGVSWMVAACYIPAQFAGAISGAVAAHLMFSLPAISAKGTVSTRYGFSLSVAVCACSSIPRPRPASDSIFKFQLPGISNLRHRHKLTVPDNRIRFKGIQ